MPKTSLSLTYLTIDISAKLQRYVPPGKPVLMLAEANQSFVSSAASVLPGKLDNYWPVEKKENSDDCRTLLTRSRELDVEYLLVADPSDSWLAGHAGLSTQLARQAKLVAENTGLGTLYFIGQMKFSCTGKTQRVVALLATFNEERFIENQLAHLTSQGVEVYLLDNESTDRTVELARPWLGRGLLEIERLPRRKTFCLQDQLRRKEQLAARLPGDWFMHVDADEIHLPPETGCTLAEAFTAVDAAGYSTINFQEFTFIPTRESPDHDHPDYRNSMQHYYPFGRQQPYGIRAWKRSADPVSLVKYGGHQCLSSTSLMCPVHFVMKHYQFLSVEHSIRRYGQMTYDSTELEHGWHNGVAGWRSQFPAEAFELASMKEFRLFIRDDQMDSSDFWRQHYLEKMHGKRVNENSIK